jgi:hypothetical protein
MSLEENSSFEVLTIPLALDFNRINIEPVSTGSFAFRNQTAL